MRAFCLLTTVQVIVGLLTLQVASTSTVLCPSICKCGMTSGKITSADCSSKGLHSVPKDLPSTVEKLDLSNNLLSSLSSDDLGYVRNLTILIVSQNLLQSVSFSTTYHETRLTRLDTLDLHGNALTSVNDNVFNSLTSLRILNLSTNRISSLGSHAFSGLKNLQTLNLFNNSLTLSDQIYPENVFEPLHQLVELNVKRNLNFPPKASNIEIPYYDSLTLHPLSQNNHLQNLSEQENIDPSATSGFHTGIDYLSHFNNVRDSPCRNIKCSYPDKALSYLRNLRMLRLDGLEDTSLILGPGFKKLTLLSFLDFGNSQPYCYLGKITELFFSNINTLEPLQVFFTDCRLTNVHPKAFSYLPTLQAVSFAGCENLEFAGFLNASKSFSATTEIIDLTYIHRLSFITLHADYFVELRKTNVKSLIIEHNVILQIDTFFLALLPKSITYLSLAKNKIIVADFLIFLKAMPNLEIFNVSIQNKYSFHCNDAKKDVENSNILFVDDTQHHKAKNVKNIQKAPTLDCLSLHTNSPTFVHDAQIKIPKQPESSHRPNDVLIKMESESTHSPSDGQIKMTIAPEPSDRFNDAEMKMDQRWPTPSSKWTIHIDHGSRSGETLYSVYLTSEVIQSIRSEFCEPQYSRTDKEILMNTKANDMFVAERDRLTKLSSTSLDRLQWMLNSIQKVENETCKEPVNDVKFLAVPVPPRLRELYASELKLGFSVPKIEMESNVMQIIDLSKNFLYCMDGPFLGLGMLKELDLSENFCTAISGYFLESMVNLSRLHLQLNALGDSLAKDKDGLIFHKLQKLQYLDLSDNAIYSLTPLAFKANSKLTELILKANALYAFSPSIAHLSQLKRLDLSKNNIRMLSHSNMADMDVIEASSNLTVDLENNPLVCDCSSGSLRFLTWYKTRQEMFTNHHTYTCTNDKGVAVLLDEVDLLAVWRSCYGLQFLLVAVIVDFILLVLYVIFYFRYRLYFLIYINKKKYFRNLVNHDDLKDVSIIYDDEDEKWRGFVLNTFNPKLAELGLSCYSSEVGGPVAAAGRPIGQVIQDSVLSSKKTVVLLTRELFYYGPPDRLQANEEKEIEMNMVKLCEDMIRGSGQRLIVMKLEHVRAERLPPQFRYILESRDILDYTTEGHRVWQQLAERVRSDDFAYFI